MHFAHRYRLLRFGKIATVLSYATFLFVDVISAQVRGDSPALFEAGFEVFDDFLNVRPRESRH